MRVDLLVLFTSCALLVCASDASNVRGSNPITPSDMSAIVQPVSESKQDIPEKRLLRTNKSKNHEERTPTDAFLKSVGLKLTGDKAVKNIMESIGHDHPTPSDFFRSKQFPVMASHFKDRPDEFMTALLNSKFDKKGLALGIYRAKKSGTIGEEFANALMNGLSNTFRDIVGVFDEPVHRIFQILMETKDPKNPFTMDIEEIKALEDFIKFRAADPRNRESGENLASVLMYTLVQGSTSKNVGGHTIVSMICKHRSEPGAKLLEKTLFDHLRVKGNENDGVVKRLFDYAYMDELKTNLLTSEQFNMLDRFNMGLSGSTFKSDASSKVKTLRNLFGNDKDVAKFLSEAENEGTEEVKKAAMELKAEFSRQRAI